MDTIALVLAAGKGTRFGGAHPKVWERVAGKPVLCHAVDGFLAHPAITAVQAVIAPGQESAYTSALGPRVGHSKLRAPCFGGASRQESARLGLEHVQGAESDRVLISDGARPRVSSALIERLLERLDDVDGVIPVLEVTDSLHRVRDGVLNCSVDRAQLARAQTPQAFRLGAIKGAHQSTEMSATDDAALAVAAGLTVATVAGDPENIKITTPEDAERFAASQSTMGGAMRVGQGFDVHAFGADPGPIMLCGVPVPHTHSLDGHSDADVGLHALCDAIYGALGVGDIGTHFPPSDSQWRGTDSALFLEHAVVMAREHGWRIVNADLTVIAQAPAIAPHREAMVQRLQALMAGSAINIKATTTEGLGFMGRGEGIAVQAVVLLAGT